MKHEEKIFIVVVEKRQRYEIEVGAFDAHGARGQLHEGGSVVFDTNGPEWRAVGRPELVVTDAREKPTFCVCGSRCHACDPEA